MTTETKVNETTEPKMRIQDAVLVRGRVDIAAETAKLNELQPEARKGVVGVLITRATNTAFRAVRNASVYVADMIETFALGISEGLTRRDVLSYWSAAALSDTAKDGLEMKQYAKSATKAEPGDYQHAFDLARWFLAARDPDRIGQYDSDPSDGPVLTADEMRWLKSADSKLHGKMPRVVLIDGPEDGFGEPLAALRTGKYTLNHVWTRFRAHMRAPGVTSKGRKPSDIKAKLAKLPVGTPHGTAYPTEDGYACSVVFSSLLASNGGKAMLAGSATLDRALLAYIHTYQERTRRELAAHAQLVTRAKKAGSLAKGETTRKPKIAKKEVNA